MTISEEELARDLRATGKRLMELPGERPYQLVLSSVETAIVGHDLILAADRIETLRQENERLREGLKDALDGYATVVGWAEGMMSERAWARHRDRIAKSRQLLQGTP